MGSELKWNKCYKAHAFIGSMHENYFSTHKQTSLHFYKINISTFLQKQTYLHLYKTNISTFIQNKHIYIYTKHTYLPLYKTNISTFTQNKHIYIYTNHTYLHFYKTNISTFLHQNLYRKNRGNQLTLHSPPPSAWIKVNSLNKSIDIFIEAK